MPKYEIAAKLLDERRLFSHTTLLLHFASVVGRIHFGNAGKPADYLVVVDPNQRELIVRNHNICRTGRLQVDIFSGLLSRRDLAVGYLSANDRPIDDKTAPVEISGV